MTQQAGVDTESLDKLRSSNFLDRCVSSTLSSSENEAFYGISSKCEIVR